VAFERVDGRDEVGGLTVLDEPEAVCLMAVEDATLGLAIDDVPALDIGFVLVDFSGGGLGVVGSLGAVTFSGSVETGATLDSSYVTLCSVGVVSCKFVPTSGIESG
jgi:hypothetical protein